MVRIDHFLIKSDSEETPALLKKLMAPIMRRSNEELPELEISRSLETSGGPKAVDQCSTEHSAEWESIRMANQCGRW